MAKKHKKKIIIIEDNKFMAKLLARRFAAAGYEAEVCADGEDGLKKTVHDRPSAVLVDLLLPGELDGFEVLRRIRAEKETVSLPVVVLTNLEGQENIDRIAALGARYLVKAYADTDEVVKAVEEQVAAAQHAKGETGAEGAPGEAGATPGEAGLPISANEVKRSIEQSLLSPEEVSIIRLVDDLVAYAFSMRASDIHINPGERALRVRFRIDGVMHDVFSFPKDIHSEVITRIKVLSGLRTDEHQMAQDGRFKARIGKGSADVRVSIAPTYYGENSVMRILAEQAQQFRIETLGFSGVNFKKIVRAIQRPYGMVLTTGPTGSGKTTTLYSVLKQLNTEEVSVITIEDPIEYSLKGIDQIQVNTRTGLTFAHGLRFILRQDPDIIMVGEIRDDETANIAVNAAMTGHLLLSTLHANNAATSLPRLLDMGVEPFLIGSTINIVMSQRLVRMLCPECRVPKELTDVELENLKEFVPARLLQQHTTFYMGKGCKMCGNTGYKSRVGIHEVLEMSDAIRSLVMEHANSSEIQQMAVKEGMVTMLEDGFAKAAQGFTSIEEVLRVFQE